jgi:hypothetical protein
MVLDQLDKLKRQLKQGFEKELAGRIKILSDPQLL